MDYKKILIKVGESVGVFALLFVFIILLTLVMMSLGPQAPPTPTMTCDIVNATTFCHF